MRERRGGVSVIDGSLRAELEELTTNMCRALNDPKRLMILYALGDQQRSVGDLCELLDLAQSNVSQHLAVLRDRGIVDSTREANRIIYTLRDQRVLHAIDLLRNVMNDEVARRHALGRRRPAKGARG
ncbi:MAG: metalloregulator ArsR/SmtB family transcription factor [Acidimicrobiales bacterium]